MAKSPPSAEYEAFTKLTDRLLAAPRDVVQQRINAHREASAKNPKRRGPKKKA
jgi:hypothetical protein